MLCRCASVPAASLVVALVLQGCSNTSPTTTSSVTTTSSPTLQCTTMSGNVSLGQRPCAAGTVACLKVREISQGSEVAEQACDDKGVCALIGNPQSCCVLSASDITQDIICSAKDFDSPLAEKDFANCERACDVSPATTPTMAPTTVSSTTTASSPVSSTSGQGLECTTMSGNFSLGQRPCAAGTVACLKVREIFGDSEVAEQACDDKGVCALIGNPQSCCVLSTPGLTQDIICSAKDFDSPLAEKDFADCDRACDVSVGGIISVV